MNEKDLVKLYTQYKVIEAMRILGVEGAEEAINSIASGELREFLFRVYRELVTGKVED